MQTRTLAVAGALIACTAPALAGPRIDMFVYENADNVDTDLIDVWVEINDLGGQIEFVVGNDSVTGDVTSIYFEDTAFSSGALLNGAIVDNADVEMSPNATPPNPAGSINGVLGGVWGGNIYSVDPDNPGSVANSLNSGEQVSFVFDLGSASYADILSALTSDPAGFRIATHVQRVGDNDASLWTVVPAPASASLMGLGGLLMVRRRRA